MIYLDNAATTMIKPVAVERAVLRAMHTMASPGRGGHDPAMRAAEQVLSCREAAARLFNVPDCERVVFTMNATHALNIAIRSLAVPGSRVVVSGFEHNSVTRPLAELGAEIVIAAAPLFRPEALIEQFRKMLPGASLAVCTHVSNAFGYILPIYEIAALCSELEIPLIVDASQSAGILDVDYAALGAAFIAMPGHKGLFGPQGTGVLICAQEGKPLLSGGSGSDSVPQHMPDYLPDRLEAGTHNVCGIAGLREGIAYVSAHGTGELLRHERELLRQMAEELSGIDELQLFYSGGDDQSGVLSLRSSALDCEDIAAGLNRSGIFVRSGLHCSPFAHRSVGTLRTGTVRFSFSPFVSPEDIDRTCARMAELLQ